MVKHKKHKGKGKHKKHKGKRKAKKGGSSFRGKISYTPCRNAKGMFAKKPTCRR